METETQVNPIPTQDDTAHPSFTPRESGVRIPHRPCLDSKALTTESGEAKSDAGLQTGLRSIPDSARDALAQFDFLGGLSDAVNASQLITFNPPDVAAAVYFLIRKGVVVYVGKTTSILVRFTNHVATPPSPFDTFKYLPVPKEHLDWIEAELICRLRPEGNRDIPVNMLEIFRSRLEGRNPIPVTTDLESRRIKCERGWITLRPGGWYSGTEAFIINELKLGAKLTERDGDYWLLMEGKAIRPRQKSVINWMVSGDIVRIAGTKDEYLWVGRKGKLRQKRKPRIPLCPPALLAPLPPSLSPLPARRHQAKGGAK